MQPRRSSPLRLVVVGLALFGLAACGFQPLYGERGVRSVSSDELAAVQIDLIRDREGQMLRNELLDRFQAAGSAVKPLYGLSIGLQTSRAALGIRTDETASRVNLTMFATYVVRDIATGVVLFKGQGRSIDSFDILDSDFASTSSEADAIRRAVYDLSEQITTRVSIALSNYKSTKTARP
jgi:LPS-assembly lipoprotein